MGARALKPDGPRPDDGRGPAVPLRRDLQDGQPAGVGATVEEIEDIYLQSWKLGLKATAVYRDNCKVGQPLATGKGENKGESSNADPPRSSRSRPR